jgi:exodeoxyribonuclease VII small subunit
MSKKQTTAPTFEAMLQELTTIVQQLEQGDLPLETSLQQFEQGINLVRLSQQQLQAAEQKVQMLVQQQGSEQLVPFAPLTGE